MKPLFDNVAFTEVKVEAQSTTLIITSTNTATYGKVIAVGDEVSAGLIEIDDVIVPNWAEAKRTVVDGETVFLIREYEILAKM
jgi:co-chaperonin GroES (HSP10)